MGNWDRKNELENHAREWNLFTDKNNANDTKLSIEGSKIYEPAFNVENTTTIMTVQDTSQAAIFKTKFEGKKAVLNFASYKKPGGGYISGAMAQEESLCHCSNLYNVISDEKFKNAYYGYNNAHLNRGLYDSRIIYSPNIVFYNKDKTKTKTCDVITCAAPNKKAAQEYQKVSDEEITAVMKDRILNILHVASQNKVDVLILGAFGCGVFGNDIESTARIFKECLTDYHYYKNVFKLVVFAIPDTPTFTKFKTILD